MTSNPRLALYLSRAYQLRGRNDEAIVLLNDVVQLFGKTGDHAMEMRALMGRSASLRFKGAYQMAVRDSRRALDLAKGYGTVLEQADAHVHLGSAYAQQGRYPPAEKEFRAALSGYQQEGNLFQLSEVHKRLGSIYSGLANYSRAAAHFDLARQCWEKLGNQNELCVTLNNMCYLYCQQGEYATAEPLALEAISLGKATGSLRDEAYAIVTLADVQRERGAYTESLQTTERGLKLARQCMETQLITYGLVIMGETYRLIGNVDKARSLLNEGLAMADEHDQEFEHGLGLVSLGIIDYQTRNYESSEATLDRACEALTRLGQKRALATARLHLAYALFLSKKYTASLAQVEKVAQICGELGHHRFLALQARAVPLLVQYAAKRSKHGDFFEQLMTQSDLDLSDQETRAAADVSAGKREISSAPRLEAHTLAKMNVYLNGSYILGNAWGSAKAMEMLLYMLYGRHPLHKEKIVEALWPNISSSKVNSNFHSTLYRMRAALYPHCVERDGEHYRLNPEWTYSLDVHEFERLLAESGRTGESSAERESRLSSAVEIYQGPFLEEVDSEWSNGLRSDLEFKFLKAVQDLAYLHEAKGEFNQGIALLERVIATDELQEEAYYKIIDLHLAADDRASAAAMHRRCLSLFGDATDLADAPEIRRLLARLG